MYEWSMKCIMYYEIYGVRSEFCVTNNMFVDVVVAMVQTNVY